MMIKIRLYFVLFFIVNQISISAQDTRLYYTSTYKERMSYFESEKLDTAQIVFLGNSLTQGGDWSSFFPNQKPKNRGISGDNTEGMVARLNEIVESRPSKLFFLGGINDISQDVPNKEIVYNIRLIIRRFKAESPNTILYIQSPLPVNNDFGRYKRLKNKEKQIEDLNKEIKRLCEKENITFVNLYPHFLSKKRTLNPEYTTDGLHLNKEGYIVWVNLIRQLIEK